MANDKAVSEDVSEDVSEAVELDEADKTPPPLMVQQFRAARRASTPLIAIRTPDQAATISLVTKNLKSPIIVGWDICQGLFGVNDAGKTAVNTILSGGQAAMISSRPSDALSLAKKMPERSILFLKNAHNILFDPIARQGIWNLRDIFKEDKRTVVLLGPDFSFPPDLINDIVPIDEALPNMDELGATVLRCYEDAGIETPPSPEMLEKAKDALIGLPAFPAEQVVAMSFTLEGSDGTGPGLDIESVWERKRRAIEDVPGLSVFRGTETFENIGGYGNIKRFLSLFLNGMEPPRLLVFVDEIEKAIGRGGKRGAGGGDVERGMMGNLLSEMEDERYNGIILLGFPGCSKSLLAKAAGNEAQIPTIQFDMNGMKNSLVGESEANMRQALKVIRAMGQRRVFFIATCNSIEELPPELRRRFSAGTFFCDLPTQEERDLIWPIHRAAFKIPDTYERPKDDLWTGADIRNCCQNAYLLRTTLLESASYMAPFAVSQSELIETMRSEADGAYISASEPGFYHYDVGETVKQAQGPSGRRKGMSSILEDDE